MTYDPTNPQHRISAARTQIILRDPFFATILMDMDIELDDAKTETCATDGDKVFFNASWLAQADTKLITAAMRKMSLHVALSHHLRRGLTRNVGRWQAACDQAALHIMQKEGLELPEGAVVNPLFNGMIAEEIYRHLEENQDSDGGADQPQGGAGAPDASGQPQGGADGADQPQGGAGAPDASGQPQGGPGVGHALDGAPMHDRAAVGEAQTKNDQRIIRAAMAEKAAGKESGTAKELVDKIKAQGVDWRDHLQQFINDRAVTRRAWRRPDRRFVGMDVYLPGKVADGIDTLAFLVDTSGSMSNDELAMCVGQIEAAREAIGIKRVVVIECDARVHGVHEFDATQPLPKKMGFKGRGGTNMVPGFKACRDVQPTAVICLTDAEFGSVITEDPGAPVLFAVTHRGRKGPIKAAFGSRVDLPDPKIA